MSAALDKIKAMDCDFITPDVAASVWGGNPQFIREEIKADPYCYGFFCYTSGRNSKIPRIPFIQSIDPDWVPNERFDKIVEAAVAAVLEKLGVSA